MNHYGLLQLDKKKFQKYRLINKSSRDILDAEQKASEAFSLFSFINLEHKKKKEKNYQIFLQLMDNLDQTYNTVKTNRFLLFYLNAKSLYLNELQDYHEIIKLCEEILYELDKKQFDNTTLIYILFRKKMNSYFNLGEIDKALIIAADAKTYTKEGTQNWYVSSYYQCLFLLHQKKYEIANEIMEQTLKGKSSRYLSPILKEYWLTLEAYIELLKLYGKIEGDESKFRVQKFINDIPVYQKEKQGRKVAVLLVQLMFFLGRNEYGKYIDRLEALQQYRIRHLGEPNTYRANCIIKMMTKVGKLSFHPVRIKAHTTKDVKSLSSKTAEFSNSSADVEIIPYEHLWEMVLEMLDKNLKNNA